MYVLVVCNRKAPTIELAHLVRAMPRLSHLKPLVLLGAADLKKSLAPDLFDHAVEYLLTNEIARPFGLNPGRGWNFAAKVARAFRFNVLADFLLVMRASAMGKNALRSILKNQPCICAVVTADDRSLGFEFGIVHAARKRGIASITVPFALSDPGGDWLRRRDRSEFSVDTGWFVVRWLKKELARIYPANVREQDGVKLMFLTAGQVLALRFLHALFPAPWAYGGGATDMVTLYSESIKVKLLQLGVPAEKMLVTGQCAMDELYILAKRKSELKRELIVQYGLQGDQPLIVLAVPQHAEHGLMGSADHNDMTKSLFSNLRRIGAEVLLSLHPRSRIEDYQLMANCAGAAIATQPLLEILPAANLFVATHSSTVRWAALLKIPTIVLDDFGVGENGMFDAHSVTFITDRSTISEVARTLLTRTAQDENAVSHQAETDLFDGLSTQRVVSALEAICVKS
jgi:hypothetical protein